MRGAGACWNGLRGPISIVVSPRLTSAAGVYGGGDSARKTSSRSVCDGERESGGMRLRGAGLVLRLELEESDSDTSLSVPGIPGGELGRGGIDGGGRGGVLGGVLGGVGGNGGSMTIACVATASVAVFFATLFRKGLLDMMLRIIEDRDKQ